MNLHARCKRCAARGGQKCCWSHGWRSALARKAGRDWCAVRCAVVSKQHATGHGALENTCWLVVVVVVVAVGREVNVPNLTVQMPQAPKHGLLGQHSEVQVGRDCKRCFSSTARSTAGTSPVERSSVYLSLTSSGTVAECVSGVQVEDGGNARAKQALCRT